VPAESGDTRTNVAVVFLTACSDIDTCDAAKESGSLAYLLRPRLCSDLVPAINVALGGTRLSRRGLATFFPNWTLIQETASVQVDLMHLRAEALENQRSVHKTPKALQRKRGRIRRPLL
jgi:DNA-binding NarL/FixJ family response regulator